MARKIGMKKMAAGVAALGIGTLLYQAANRDRACPKCNLILRAVGLFESVCPNCSGTFVAFNLLKRLLA